MIAARANSSGGRNADKDHLHTRRGFRNLELISSFMAFRRHPRRDLAQPLTPEWQTGNCQLGQPCFSTGETIVGETRGTLAGEILSLA
jgi:hypothetical protein